MVRLLSLLVLTLATLTELRAACRPLPHVMGETCVPAQPQRVVVLDTGELDMALTLGVQPLAATTPNHAGQFPDYLRDRLSSPVDLGVPQEPDMERLAALKPDLILGSKLRHGRYYRLLSSIAPTVMSERIGASWADNLQLFARALNRKAEARQWLQQFEQRCAQVRQLAQASGNPRVSVVRSMQSHIRLYLQNSFVGNVLQRCGIRRPDSQQGQGFAVRLRSPVAIRQLDADILLLSEYAVERGSLIRRWQRSGFWQLLQAPARGQLYPVADSWWMLGIGPTAALKILDDLEQVLIHHAQN